MKLKSLLLATVFSFALTPFAMAESASDLFFQGRDAKNQGSYSQAAKLFKQACNSDGGVSSFEVIACMELGFLYEDGKGVKQDYAQAVKLYEKACYSGNGAGASACYLLKDDELRNKAKRAEQEYAQTAKLYEKACNGGDADGCFNLGWLYDDGQGVKQNYAQAAKFYEQACNGGVAAGCTNLGLLYNNGQGVQQSQAKARRLYEKACNNNNEYGCHNLGAYYYRHLDYDNAQKYSQKACDLGLDDSCDALFARKLLKGTSKLLIKYLFEDKK